MEYMEQQMQQQIEAGLSNAEQCYARIAELEEQNAALVATIAALRGAAQQLSFEIACDPSESQFKSFSRLQDVLAATPQHHLRQVRAESGRDGFIFGVKVARKMYGCELGHCKTEVEEAAEQYHVSILAGKE